MRYQNVFRRYEAKYLITPAQKQRLLETMAPHMEGDTYGRSTICNLYFDTPDHRLIRRSLEKPVYKEKLRVRSYGVATPDSTVFVELKKKYRRVVYKRRVALCEAAAMDYLCRRQPVGDTQILREIDYFLDFYGSLRPAMFLSYQREAFYDKEDRNFRITFDENIQWRQEELSLCSSPDGRRLLEDDRVLMEIKTATALPLWLTSVLTEERIFRTSFSKYGMAYSITQIQTEGFSHVG